MVRKLIVMIFLTKLVKKNLIDKKMVEKLIIRIFLIELEKENLIDIK